MGWRLKNRRHTAEKNTKSQLQTSRRKIQTWNNKSLKPIFMKEEYLKEILQSRPAVHELYYGAFIQEPLQIKANLFAIPLIHLGFEAQTNYLGQYSVQIAKIAVDQGSFDNLITQGREAFPVIALVFQNPTDDLPELLEKEAREEFKKAIKVLSWATGDEISAFGVLTLTQDQSFFRLSLPHSNKRLRLGFGNTGPDFENQIKSIIAAIEKDEHFEFGISMYHDALKESNPKFQIARFFCCLECLAHKIKSEERPSRKAVKYLLGLEDGAFSEIHVDGKKYRYDTVEIAGRIRDKLFHGVKFKKKDLIKEARETFELYENHPELIASDMKSYCEMEITKWANGTSRGLKVPKKK